MINPVEQLQAMRHQLDHLDTSAMQQRIETNLRSIWNTIPMENLSQQKKWNWRIFNYAIGGSGLAVLALVTTLLNQPTTQHVTQSETTITAPKDKTTTSNNYDLTFDAASTAGLSTEDLILDDEEPAPVDYSYRTTDSTEQLFDESVNLSIDVKGEMLDTIHALREQVTTLHGYLVNIAYYNDNGTIDIKLPTDQLSAFEDALKQLDADQTVVVNSYDVTNVSNEVVSIDEGIKLAQDTITQDQADLNTTGLTADETQAIQDKITANQEYIKQQQTARDEAIAQYNLVAVQVIVNQYQSFWEGNHTQYDRSTFSGQIKYELGQAIYSLIHSTSKVVAFFIWLAVYSVILIPIFLLLRWIMRSIIRKIKKL